MLFILRTQPSSELRLLIFSNSKKYTFEAISISLVAFLPFKKSDVVFLLEYIRA